MKGGGAKIWYFPDGYLPHKREGEKVVPHEALMLLNVGDADANALIDLYFSDREPIRDIPVKVPAERIISLRMDAPADLGCAVIPELTQYAIRITSDQNLVAQFGRLDTTQANLAYYGSDGFHE